MERRYRAAYAMKRTDTTNRSDRREQVANLARGSATSRLRFVVVIGCGLLAVAGWAQFGNSGVVRGFKFPEFFERAPGQTNRLLKTLITGSEARPAAGVYDVK